MCDRSWGPRPLPLIILTTAISVLPAIALPFCLEYWTFILSFGLVGFFAGCNIILREGFCWELGYLKSKTNPRDLSPTKSLKKIQDEVFEVPTDET